MISNRQHVSHNTKGLKFYSKALNLTALLHPENPLYATLSCTAVEALRVVELPRNEYLLVFRTLAAYVDRSGRRSRDREIMYPAVPTDLSEYIRFDFYLQKVQQLII